MNGSIMPIYSGTFRNGYQYMYSANLGYNIVSQPVNRFSIVEYNNIINMDVIKILFNYATGEVVVQSMKQNQNLKKLWDIQMLDDNWNGYNGKAISSIIVETAQKIVQKICIQPQIFPTGRNSIQMQFELEDRSYLEFEIFEEKIICMEVPRRVYSEASFFELQIDDIPEINKIVKEFYG